MGSAGGGLWAEVRSHAPSSRPSGRADSGWRPRGRYAGGSAPPPRRCVRVSGLPLGRRGGDERRGPAGSSARAPAEGPTVSRRQTRTCPRPLSGTGLRVGQGQEGRRAPGGHRACARRRRALARGLTWEASTRGPTRACSTPRGVGRGVTLCFDGYFEARRPRLFLPAPKTVKLLSWKDP